MSNVQETASAAADATTGAAAEAVDAATDPAARVRRLVRRGAPINRDLVRTARQVVDGGERAARTGLRVVKSRARRRDLVGVATYRALELVHEGAGTAARALTRLEEATQPPARQTGNDGRRPAGGHTATRPEAKARTGQRKSD